MLTTEVLKFRSDLQTFVIWQFVCVCVIYEIKEHLMHWSYLFEPL